MVGSLPPVTEFGAVPFDEPIPGGDLYRCIECALLYKDHDWTPERLRELYAKVPTEEWDNAEGKRPDFALAAEVLEGVAGGPRILDIGCFAGHFLHGLPSRFQKYGIEVNPKARAIARERGINVISEDFESLPGGEYEAFFDVVVAMDVIEHSFDPARFVAESGRLVKPGGCLIISTGNADAPTFRWMAPSYWYCSYAEHMVFPSPRWISWVADKAGFKVESVRCYSHAARSLAGFARQTMANAFYRFSPGAYQYVRDSKGSGAARRRRVLGPPTWNQARDHFLVVLEKNR